MRPHRGRRPALVAALTAAGVALPSAAWAGPPSTHYVVTVPVQETHQATGADGDTGVCTPQETAHFTGTQTIRLRSTVAGLTDAQVVALTESPEVDASVLDARSETRGTLVVRSGSHTYTTRYTDRWAVRPRDGVVTITSRFLAVGRSEQGTPFTISATGLLVQAGDRTLADREDQSVRGCLP
ncbi:hypothetical protein [Geodermatophilus sp. SYSU D00710]